MDMTWAIPVIDILPDSNPFLCFKIGGFNTKGLGLKMQETITAIIIAFIVDIPSKKNF
jgi:hypothetical protein